MVANNGIQVDLWGTRHMNQGRTSLIIQHQQALSLYMYVCYMRHNMYNNMCSGGQDTWTKEASIINDTAQTNS